jgi:hypothetical protein
VAEGSAATRHIYRRRGGANRPRRSPYRPWSERELQPLRAEPDELGCLGRASACRPSVPAFADRPLPLADAHVWRNDASGRPPGAGRARRAHSRSGRPPRSPGRAHAQGTIPAHSSGAQSPRDRAANARGTHQARASRARAAAQKAPHRARAAISRVRPARAGATRARPPATQPMSARPIRLVSRLRPRSAELVRSHRSPRRPSRRRRRASRRSRCGRSAPGRAGRGEARRPVHRARASS